MSASPLVTYRKTFCRLAENISSYKRSPHKSSTYNSQIKKIVTMLYQELQKLYIINKMQAKTISVLGKKKILGKKFLGLVITSDHALSVRYPALIAFLRI